MATKTYRCGFCGGKPETDPKDEGAIWCSECGLTVFGPTAVKTRIRWNWMASAGRIKKMAQLAALRIPKA